MTKADLVAKIAAKASISKVGSERSLNAFLEAVQEILVEEGRLTLTGFGTFSVESRKARTGRNPRTGAAIKIPASKVVKFHPGKNLKEAVN
jgi:DNA-binding protein HU-beta